jgi:hypothetical protein
MGILCEYFFSFYLYFYLLPYPLKVVSHLWDITKNMNTLGWYELIRYKSSPTRWIDLRTTRWIYLSLAIFVHGKILIFFL